MTTDPTRIAAVRTKMQAQNLDGFVIPLTDEHMSEYVGAYAQRLSWLTGFDGSAGFAVVLKRVAAIFVDGRYTVQVRNEVDSQVFQYQDYDSKAVSAWISDNMTHGERLGFDPELATIGWKNGIHDSLSRVGAELVATSDNPVDAAWTDQPALPPAPARIHGLDHAGEKAEDKRARVAQVLKKAGADACAVTMLDNIAWAFNIRGDDVTHTPVVQAFAVLRADESATLYINDAKLTDAVRDHLGNGVEIAPRDRFYTDLSAMAAGGKSLLLDPESNNAKVFETVRSAGGSIIEGADPTSLMKAVKNAAEADGTRAAHVRDGAAVSDFLAWFDRRAPEGGLTELDAVAALWEARKAQGAPLDQSFDTISGSGPNGAIVHYRVSKESNRTIEAGDVYLVDSGAQYKDGTTDITRTTSVGLPSDEVRDRFTRVLKGHIALATTLFPAGTSGQSLDAIARRPLWEAGFDYAHGTGHGVGSYLAVHEGPQRIAKQASGVALRPGMILSNEPGYYKEDAYGIRIENLVLVVPSETAGDHPVYEFETLTVVPIDRHMIAVELLSQEELNWINTYHARVYSVLKDLVKPETQAWLTAMTAPLTRAETEAA